MNSIITEFVNNCSFEQIKEKAKENEIIYRENENLYLLTSKNTDEPSELQRACNGAILEKETNKIICSCQPSFLNLNELNDATYKIGDVLKLNNTIRNLIKNGHFEYCEDGTVIRLYNYQNQWTTATSKCIDAKNSFWTSNQTFDEMFWQLFPSENVKTLDSNCTYVFVLIHKDNRIVIKHSENYLMFVCVINNVTNEIISDFNFENESTICHSNVISKTENENDFEFSSDDMKSIKIQKNELNNENLITMFEKFYNNKKRGILVSNGNLTYKFDFASFKIIKDIRGNIPQIRMRYLELLDNPEELKMLEQYYSEYHMLFSMIKFTLEKLFKNVHYLYVQSHIKHKIKIEEGHLFYQTLRQLHGQYKKTNQVITLDDVKNKIVSLDKHVIKNFLGWV
jgi:hypothetical protein